MTKRIILIIVAVLAVLMLMAASAFSGGVLTYLVLRARTAQSGLLPRQLERQLPFQDRDQLIPREFGNMPFMDDSARLSGGTVTEVIAGSPAEAAGLKVGDVITGVDGAELSIDNTLANAIQAHQPGDQVTLTVQREGEDQSIEIQVTLVENPDQAGSAYLGVKYQPILSRIIPDANPGEQGQGIIPEIPFFEMPPGDGSGQEGQESPFDQFFKGIPFGDLQNLPEGVRLGAVVVEIVPDSPADNAGLKVNDVITELDSTAISGPDALVKVLQSKQPGDQVEVKVLRVSENPETTMTVILGNNPESAGSAYLGIKVGSLVDLNRQTSPNDKPVATPQPGKGDA